MFSHTQTECHEKIHFLEAVDLRRLQDVQSRQDLHGHKQSGFSQNQNRPLTNQPSSPTRPYIVVFEEAEHPQLSEDPLTGHQVLEDIGHLLQGHLAAVAWIRDGPARVRASRLAD